MKNVTFTGRGNTLANQSKQENKSISLVPEAHLVPAGIARVVELEEHGWSYARPWRSLRVQALPAPAKRA